MAKLQTGIPFIDNLFGRTTQPAAIASSSPFVAYLVGGPAVYPDPNSLNYIKLGFSGNGSIYTIVSTAARKFGYLPRYTYKISDPKALRSYKALLKQNPRSYKKAIELHEKAYAMESKAYEEMITGSPFDRLLKNPNPKDGQDSFYALIYVYYKITGEAFIYLNRGFYDDNITPEQLKKLPVLEMWVLPSQFMIIKPDPLDVNGVDGYYLEVAGVRQPIRKENVIHWKTPNPNFDAYSKTHLRGLSPLQAGNKLVTQDDSATDAAVAMHQNDGAKGALVNTSKDNLNAVQKSQLEDVINRKVNNRDIKGSIATLQGTWDFLDMSQSSVDMQLLESQEKTFIRLCNLLGVPPEIFVVGNTYENKDQARRDLITTLLLPDACSLRDVMNPVLLESFGLSSATDTHDVDITNLPELQEDIGKMVTGLVPAFWLTPNERRKKMGEEEDPDPNMDKIWVPNNLVMMEDVGQMDQLDSFTNDTSTNTGASEDNSGMQLSNSKKPSKAGLSNNR